MPAEDLPPDTIPLNDHHPRTDIVERRGFVFALNHVIPLKGCIVKKLTCLGWLFCLTAGLALIPVFGCTLRQKGPDEEYRIPAREVRSEHTFSESKNRFMVRQTLEPFRKYASPHPTNAEAAQFLEAVCRAVSFASDAQTYSELAQEGARLVAAGGNDPLVRLWYGQMLFITKQDTAAEPYLLSVYQWGENSYPDLHAFLALRSLGCIAARRGQLRPDEAKIHLGNALGALGVAVANHEFSDDQIQIAYRWLSETSDTHFDKWDFVLTNLERMGGADVWFMDMLRGEREFDLGWKARGTGLAHTVTDEGWEKLAEHLGKARSFMMAAWQAHPERPEAAVAMLKITRAGHGNPGESETVWFNRAVQGQMDYLAAYKEMLLGLRPRWGGSHAQMRAFGHACLATERFDTEVPLFYLYALRGIAFEMRGNRWRLPFRDAREQKKLAYLFDKLRQEPGRGRQQARILAQHAMVRAWGGDYETARQMLASAGDVDLVDGFFNLSISFAEAPRPEVEAELRAFTGTHKETLIRAEALELKERSDEAQRLFEEGLAAYRGDPEIQAYLRNRIALLRLDMSGEDADDAPLIVAARENRQDVALFLLDQKAAVDVAGDDRWRPLHWAANRNHMQMAGLLLDRGADPNAPNCGDFTPLHLAIKKNHMDMVKLLVARGASLNAVSISRWAPLHYALHCGRTDLARWIIQNGADIHARGEWGWTPLMFAVSYGQADIARLLIAQGARVDEKSDQGWPPLLIMTWDGNEAMVKLLLENGADKTFALDDGSTALSIARQRNFKSIELLLQNHTGRPSLLHQ